jgi:hypothetical protein
VYVDHGDDTDTTTTADTHGGEDQLTVDMDGESYQVDENYDFDHDGHNDAAVVETDEGYIAFADTDHDGTADVAVEFDHDGNVVAGAHYDESSHQWSQEDPNSLPTPSGDGAGDHGHAPGHQGTDTQTHDSHTPGGTTPPIHDTGAHPSGDGEDITVHTKDGGFDAGKAEYDSNGDGKADTAVVTGQDGTTYAFTDKDGDGSADTAVVISADGEVTVAENTGGDNWEETQHGHLDADGTFHSDAGSSGSDSVWAESR